MSSKPTAGSQRPSDWSGVPMMSVCARSPVGPPPVEGATDAAEEAAADAPPAEAAAVGAVVAAGVLEHAANTSAVTATRAAIRAEIDEGGRNAGRVLELIAFSSIRCLRDCFRDSRGIQAA